jgi:hypothetical protein
MRSHTPVKHMPLTGRRPLMSQGIPLGPLIGDDEEMQLIGRRQMAAKEFYNAQRRV